MTGEITLSGLVLPVGGIKEKVLAAHRAGMKHLILPKDNEADLDKVPDSVRKELTITLVERLEEVIALRSRDCAAMQHRHPRRRSRAQRKAGGEVDRLSAPRSERWGVADAHRKTTVTSVATPPAPSRTG